MLNPTVTKAVGFSIQISSGEYIQMSGRAGRRGIDDKGIVVLMVDEKMSPVAGKQIVKVNILESILHRGLYSTWSNKTSDVIFQPIFLYVRLVTVNGY